MKRPISGIIILLFFLSSCIQQNKVKKLGQEGTVLFDKGDINGALKKFDEIIKVNDHIPEVYLKKGDCLKLLGDIKGSINSYSRAIEIEPKSKIAIYNRALSYEKIGAVKESIADYRRAIKIDPYNSSGLNNKVIYHNLGVLYVKTNKSGKAIEALSKAIEIDDQYADAYYNLGNAYQLEGNHKGAIEEFEKALKIDPDNSAYEAAKKVAMEMVK